jgi:drug/metabolite transporter (DMT)-like permease
MKIRLTRTDLLVLGGVVIWAAGFSIAKYGLREIRPLAFAAVRFLAAAVLIVVWVWTVEGRPAIKREDWLWVVLVGLAQIGVYQLFFSVGLSQTTASNASLLDGTAPIWTAIFATVSGKETTTTLQIMGILLSIAGLSMVVVAGNSTLTLGSESIRGDIMILIAAILTGAAAVISKRLLRRYSSLRVMSISMVCGSLFLLPFAWPQMVTQRWSEVSLGAWLALAYSVVLAAVLAYVIYFKSIGEIGATRTAAYNSLMPPLAVVIAMVALGEHLMPLQVLGAIVVLGGVVLTRFAPVKRARQVGSAAANTPGIVQSSSDRSHTPETATATRRGCDLAKGETASGAPPAG